MDWTKKGRDTTTTPARGAINPLLAIAAGTGDVLMSRLREGRANTARGAAHFLRETVGRVRYGGASGQLTVRADSGFYAHALVAVCREMGVCFSITIRQHKGLRELIEAIPEQDWTPIPYWMDGAADVAETTYGVFPTSQLPGARCTGMSSSNRPAKRLNSVTCSSSQGSCTRSPVTTTKAGLSLLTAAAAFSQWSVSKANP